MPNATFLAIPATIDDAALVRILRRIVAELDVILGYRAESPFVKTQAAKDATGATTQSLAEVTAALRELEQQVAQSRHVAVAPTIATTSVTASAAYDAAELQQVNDNVENLVVAVRALSAALVAAKIISS